MQNLTPEARRRLIKIGATLEQLIVEGTDPANREITEQDINASFKNIDLKALNERLATLVDSDQHSSRAA